LNREINLWTVGCIAVATAVAITFLHPLYNPHTCYPGPASAINPEACARHRNFQVLNHTKQVGVSACIYATDYNDTFPIWSSAIGESEVLDHDHLYPEVMKNYAKDQEAWTNPKVALQMRGVRNAFAYNFWGLGGIFQCANPTFAATSPLCTDRTEARFAEFADEKYNRPARTSEIAAAIRHCLPEGGCQVHRRVVAYQDGRGPALRPGGRLERQRRLGPFPLRHPHYHGGH